jgi:hypothetical protein
MMFYVGLVVGTLNGAAIVALMVWRSDREQVRHEPAGRWNPWT